MAIAATDTQMQQHPLTMMVSSLSQANQALIEEQDRTAGAVQRTFDQMSATIQALTMENGALRAKQIETDARVEQQKASIDEELRALKDVIHTQNETIQNLTNRTTTMEGTLSWVVPALNKATNCAEGCRRYIYAIYHTLWRNTPPNIPNP